MAVLGIGAAVGGALFGAGTTAAALTAAGVNIAVSVAFSAAMAAVSRAISGDGPGFVGPRLSDTQITASTWGQGIAQVYGTVRTGGNIIQVPEDGLTETSEEVGGKGFGGGASQTSYKYFVDMEVALCESPVDNPVDDVIAIWADTKLIYDTRQQIKLKKRYKKMFVDVRLGAETQVAHSRWEEEWGSGEVPGGRGVCSVNFKRLPLIDFGNRIPNITCLVARESTAVTDAFIDWADTDTAPTVRADVFMIDEKRGNMVAEGFNGAIHYFIRYDPIEGKYLDDREGLPDLEIPQNKIPHAFDPDTGLLYASGDPDDALAVTDGVAVQFDPITLVEANWPSTAHAMTNPSNGVIIGSNTLIYIEGGVLGLKDFYGVAKASLELLWTRNPNTDWGYADRVWHGQRDPDNGEIFWLVSSDTTLDTACRLYEVNSAGSLLNTYDISGANQMGTVEDINVRIMMDPFRDQIVILMPGQNLIGLFDLSSRTFKGVLSTSFGGSNDSLTEHGPSEGGKFWVINTGTEWFEVDVTGTAPTKGQTINPNSRTGVAGGYSNILYDEEREMLICQTTDNEEGESGPQWQFLPINRTDPGGTTLDAVVAEICRKTGLVADDYDVTDLASVTVNGYLLGQARPGRDNIEPLMQGFQFDGYNGDGVLKFILRGKASADHTIDDQDVTAREPDEDHGPKIAKVRRQDTEVPRRVNLKFMDRNKDYQPGLQTDQGEQSLANDELNLEIPLALSVDEAKEMVVKIYRELQLNRDQRTIQVAFKHWDVDPTDVIEIEEQEGVFT